MMTSNDPTTTINIVSIHDMDPRGFLSFDLLQILEAIEESVREYAWVVSEIECTGQPVPIETVLSFVQLVEHAARAQQIIDGTIVGCPASYLAAADLEWITRIADFPRTQARVAILAVDSSYFDVIAKDLRIIELIRQSFRDVRVQDPRNYFEQP